MPRYIDADALKAKFCTDTSVGRYGEFMDGSEVSFTSREVDKIIDTIETVDAVPVVRCKDCQYCYYTPEGRSWDVILS